MNNEHDHRHHHLEDCSAGFVCDGAPEGPDYSQPPMTYSHPKPYSHPKLHDRDIRSLHHILEYKNDGLPAPQSATRSMRPIRTATNMNNEHDHHHLQDCSTGLCVRRSTRRTRLLGSHP